jgi:hypothetical protein
MRVEASFQTDRTEYRLGEPIVVTLSVKNVGDQDIYIFVPRGRAYGLQINVKKGRGFHLKGLEEEPEPGLVGENKLQPGATYSQQFPLGDWLIVDEPGEFTVECSIEIEVSNISLREKNEQRVVTTTTAATDLHFTVLPRAG